jgi:hypothetical protein
VGGGGGREAKTLSSVMMFRSWDRGSPLKISVDV